MKFILALALSGWAVGVQAFPSTDYATQKRQSTTTLNSLARDLERTESVREVKDVTFAFSQLAQSGRWSEMAALFTDDGVLRWDNNSTKGPAAIEKWLRTDATDMDGIKAGSLDTLVTATPLVNLAVDGRTAKARFNGWRFQGNGAGSTRIQGGIYENEYAFDNSTRRWKISLMRFYPLYAGDYANGWRNAGGGNLNQVPFHFTPDEAGIPIPPPAGEAPQTNATATELAHRISMLNDEDEVRNLQHAYGFYADRRMWTDVVDLFTANSTVTIDNFGSFSGPAGVRQAMEQWMGPEGLSQGILNENIMFDTMIHIHPTPDMPLALARGLEVGLLANKTGSWRFNIFYNRFIKENGIWKIKDMRISPLMVANYTTGWGKGSTMQQPTSIPDLLAYASRSTQKLGPDGTNTDLADMQRRLNRSAAWDGSENVSNAYGFYIDWIDGVGCTNMADIHARKAHKESPFTGFYQTRERVLKACTTYYGTTATVNRSSISFHWRPQPVILVSQDGRSATFRGRLVQPATEKSSAGIIRGAIYHDQMNLEDGIWRLWSITIDEFYWTSSNWKDGWAGVKPRDPNAADPGQSDLSRKYPPDLLLTDVGAPRETGFQGGPGHFTSWPEIQRMWFAYRNPVTGRVPDSYWPGCVPCQKKPEWALARNGYQEPPTGPNVVNGTVVPVPR